MLGPELGAAAEPQTRIQGMQGGWPGEDGDIITHPAGKAPK